MFLIMSASYVGQELQSEFGQIPPSFLPLGNRRLFQHQVKLAPDNIDIHLSIPESYTVTKTDLKWLSDNKIVLIRTPDGLSLGASLVAALNLTEHDLNSPLHVLFGDTLFTELPIGKDIVCISNVKDSYNWAVVTDDQMHWFKVGDKIEQGSSYLVNGYFQFSEPRLLMRSITQSNWKFIEGLNRYHQSVGLTTIYSDKWLDFGHVNTYYRSKANFTTQRAFNELTITPDWIEKSSEKSFKITAEANWFASLPYSLKGFTPQFLGSSKNGERVSYRLEYLYQTALNELYVFTVLPVSIWEQILNGCINFIKACQKEMAPPAIVVNELEELFCAKTIERLESYCESKSITMTEGWSFNGDKSVTLNEILECSKKYLPKKDENYIKSILHGDFCFSNILYDFRTNKIKTIDPRGITTNQELTLYGDTRYDIAKLSHSILGMYDWIIAGYYEVEITNNKIYLSIEETPLHKTIQQRFIKLVEKEFKISAVTLMAMQIQLFLSMLPLHHDDERRQKALFANAFRLFSLMKRLEE